MMSWWMILSLERILEFKRSSPFISHELWPAFDDDDSSTLVFCLRRWFHNKWTELGDTKPLEVRHC